MVNSNLGPIDLNFFKKTKPSELTPAYIKKITNLVKKHKLKININRKRSLSFLYVLWKEEELKRKKGKKYNKKMLKDAEKMILTLNSLKKYKLKSAQTKTSESKSKKFTSLARELFAGTIFTQFKDARRISSLIYEVLSNTNLPNLSKLSEKEKKKLSKKIGKVLSQKNNPTSIVLTLENIAKEENLTFFENLFDPTFLNSTNKQEFSDLLAAMHYVKESEIKPKDQYSKRHFSKALSLRKALEDAFLDVKLQTEEKRENWDVFFDLITAQNLDPKITHLIIRDIISISTIETKLASISQTESKKYEKMKNSLEKISSPENLESLFNSVLLYTEIIIPKKQKREKQKREYLEKLSSSYEHKRRILKQYIEHIFHIDASAAKEFAQKYAHKIKSFNLLDDQGANSTEKELVMIHLTRYLPNEKGLIKPTSELLDSSVRSSIHFSLNGPVSAHLYGSWDDTEIAILAPLDKLKPLVSNFNTVDTYIFGDIILPKGTIILISQEVANKNNLENGQLLGNAKIKITDITNNPSPASHYTEFRWAVVEQTADMGFLPMSIGMWSANGWWGNGNLNHLAEKNNWDTSSHHVTISKNIEDLRNSILYEGEKNNPDIGGFVSRVNSLRLQVLDLPATTLGGKRKKKHLTKVLDKCVLLLADLELEKLSTMAKTELISLPSQTPGPLRLRLFSFLSSFDYSNRLKKLDSFVELNPKKRKEFLSNLPL